MIEINDIQLVNGETTNLQIDSEQDFKCDAPNLTVLPGLIDPHVHFRVPGQEHKEDWRTASQAALRGGYTTVFDMPNNIPSCISEERLADKKKIIQQQLADVGIPLRYELYLGADKNHFDQISLAKDDVIGLKIFMGSSTGDLLMDDDESLEIAFKLAAENNLVVAVHAENECLIQQHVRNYKDELNHHAHSKIRDPEVAEKAVKQVIDLSQKYKTKVYILHVSTKRELDLIRAAKKQGIQVYAEACPHHLFLDVSAYDTLKGKAQMNPPLRSAEDRQALLDAIQDGTIDTIGSDHAPHTIDEKSQDYPKSPSGVPGIETTLPLLLNAYNQGILSLERIISLTHGRVCEMFDYPMEHDYVLVDLNKKQTVLNEDLKTKCAWSPYAGMELQGWPVYTILKNRIYDLENL